MTLLTAIVLKPLFVLLSAGGSGPAISSISSNIVRKRNYEQTGGSDGGPANKRLIMAPQRHPGKRGKAGLNSFE